MIVITAITLPFMKRSPIDLPPILSVYLIQITDKTSIPFAAKAAKTLKKIKKWKPDYIIHLAAQSAVEPAYDNPSFDILTNSLGTYLIANLAKELNVKKFIYLRVL